jgi:hypothetical protein
LFVVVEGMTLQFVHAYTNPRTLPVPWARRVAEAIGYEACVPSREHERSGAEGVDWCELLCASQRPKALQRGPGVTDAVVVLGIVDGHRCARSLARIEHDGDVLPARLVSKQVTPPMLKPGPQNAPPPECAGSEYQNSWKLKHLEAVPERSAGYRSRPEAAAALA